MTPDDINYIYAYSNKEAIEKLGQLTTSAFEYLKNCEESHIAFVFAALECDEEGNPTKVQAECGGSQEHVEYLLAVLLVRLEVAQERVEHDPNV